jgi:hypothetical protein
MRTDGLTLGHGSVGPRNLPHWSIPAKRAEVVDRPLTTYGRWPFRSSASIVGLV